MSTVAKSLVVAGRRTTTGWEIPVVLVLLLQPFCSAGVLAGVIGGVYFMKVARYRAGIAGAG